MLSTSYKVQREELGIQKSGEYVGSMKKGRSGKGKQELNPGHMYGSQAL